MIAQWQEIGPRIFAARAFSLLESIAIVAQADASPAWTRAVINADLEIDTSVRDAEILFEELHRPHADVYRERLASVTRELAQRVAPGASLGEVQLVRYHPGGRYVDHRDGPTPGPVQRSLSLVCYLNDNFAGGQTTFTELGFSVAPKTGLAIAFPPELLHRSEPVASGRKYVITAWYHSAV